MIAYVPTVLIGIGFLLFLFDGIFFVREKTNVVLERFGKYKEIRKPGLNFKVPIIDRVTAVNLKTQQLDVNVNSKTKDNVFVDVNVSVQYFIEPEKVYDAFYKLNNPKEQMKSYIYDVIRSEVPGTDIDDVFSEKEKLADAVKKALEGKMKEYGYNIVTSLVTDIDPDKGVKEAMNEINRTERLKKAAENEGEAKKTLAVKQAEAEKESKKLQGEGIAEQRKAIAKGIEESVKTVSDATGGQMSQKEVMDTLMITQHFDMLEAVGKGPNAKVIMIPTGMNEVKNLTAALETELGKEVVTPQK